MITTLIEFREMLLKIYQKIRFILNPVVKFIMSWIVFTYINDSIGFDPRFTKTIIVLGLSAVCAVTPAGVLVFFAMVLTLLHIYSVSLFLAVLLLLVFIILYGLLMRFSPKQVAAAVAVPVLAKYNLHYCVPILMGSISNPLSILPTSCGVMIYYIMKIVKDATSRTVEFELDDVVQLYTDVFDAIIDCKQMIIVVVVFALVIATVWFLRKFSFDYSFEISIAAGVVITIIGFLVADLKFDVTVKIGTLIFMSIISGFVAMLCDYMKRVLDYTAIERVQFEDDDYYYYVKAVPKVNISLREIDIKHFNRKSEDGDEYDEDEEDEGYPEDGDEIDDYDDANVDEEEPVKEKKGRKSGKNKPGLPLFDDEDEAEEEKQKPAYLPDFSANSEEPEEDGDIRIYGGKNEKRVNPYLPGNFEKTAPENENTNGRVILNEDGDYEEDMTLEDEDL